MSELLRITDLHISADEKEILHGVGLAVNTGETHVIMGPNGAGKSTRDIPLVPEPRGNTRHHPRFLPAKRL